MPRFVCFLLLPAFLSFVPNAFSQFESWSHTGRMTILTTVDGVDLPASVVVTNFPLLIRLHPDWFSFAEAAEDGRDLRVSTDGKAIGFEIEEWTQEGASVWARVPRIAGQARQSIDLHWGKADAKTASDPTAVFREENGMLGVWHMHGEACDVTGSFRSEDKGTQATNGMIAGARHFPNAGVFCGEDIEILPEGGESHSSQAWFRPDAPNGRIFGWGKEFRQGKVTMFYRSPPGIRMDCYFSNANVDAAIPNADRLAPGWNHVVHTYENNQAILYINGEECDRGQPRHAPLNIERPARLWIGGWYNRYGYEGDIDEFRISNVARSAAWVKLEYENQKPMQSLLGHLVQDGEKFAVTPERLQLREGERGKLTAEAGGAEKVRWVLVRDGTEHLLATDRFELPFDADRVRGDTAFEIRFEAVYPDGLKKISVPVSVAESLPEPVFTLSAPDTWNGRDQIEVRPKISNLEAMRSARVGKLNARWQLSGLAALHQEKDGNLILERAQNSGSLAVTLHLDNGGETMSATTRLQVTEPQSDPWVPRKPSAKEMPVDGQFYARDDSGTGLMHCRGRLDQPPDEVFLKVFTDDKLFAEKSQKPDADGRYDLAVRLDAKRVQYRVEFGVRSGKRVSVTHRADDIVCGDAFLIQGQSNALATDTREDSPRVADPWIRSYGRPQFHKPGERENLWCKPVWKAQGDKHLAELGWWGMALAKRLSESQQVPVFVLNAARGGTRIDQHQRDNADPTNLETIYGRMLWRLREAKLTHGIRAVIWHQGENDQGSAGPDGGYGWETYEPYFVAMAADWKRDMPNLRHQTLFQIWPSACAMGRDGNGDMLRERQRTLPRLYSNLSILSTYDIRPQGGCHFPLEGWEVFADRVQPLLERDLYGAKQDGVLTAANLRRAAFANGKKTEMRLTFDQPVVWADNELAKQFYLDDKPDQIESGRVSGLDLILKLKAPSEADRLTYLKEASWNKEQLLLGQNGMAALSFCNVEIELGP